MRQPVEPKLAQKERQGAQEEDGHEILNGHVCSSFQHLFLLSLAQCLSFSALESQHSQCYNTETRLHSCHCNFK